MSRVFGIESAIQPKASHKLFDDFSRAAWIRLKFGKRRFEPSQILKRNLVTTQDVPADFSDR